MSEPLKVVGYFDTLVTAGAGVDGLLRGAAALSGVVAGAQRHGRVSRRGPEDTTPPEATDHPHAPHRECSTGSVWLERTGEPHANDEIIVERLAVALDLLETRYDPVGALETAIDPARTLEERTTALAKLSITPSSRIRIIATKPNTCLSDTPSTAVPTHHGILRATLGKTSTEPPSTPAGLGTWVRADQAPRSWEAAMIAFQLTEPGMPVLDASELGTLLMLARAHDPQEPHDDIRNLMRLDTRSAHILRTLVETDSIRSAATELGMHHSTLQARHEALTRELGYDPRTTTGRIRYGTAEFLRRLTDERVAQEETLRSPHRQS
ncbi:hypothetical protein [Sciscionella sediminilitoris]|uniref:hypothetical protein n=1 Tax=Sciscionella sediminilitoris TaxID=1445613 RepID=UPI00069242D5|nr:hypothetical protein [Sciscionella sp. SE31]